MLETQKMVVAESERGMCVYTHVPNSHVLLFWYNLALTLLNTVCSFKPSKLPISINFISFLKSSEHIQIHCSCTSMILYLVYMNFTFDSYLVVLSIAKYFNLYGMSFFLTLLPLLKPFLKAHSSMQEARFSIPIFSCLVTFGSYVTDFKQFDVTLSGDITKITRYNWMILCICHFLVKYKET